MAYKSKKERIFDMFRYKATNAEVKEAFNLETWELNAYRKEYMKPRIKRVGRYSPQKY